MTWHIDIERVHNGFIVRSDDPSGESEEEYVRLISWTDQTNSKLNAYVELLYEISEHFGMLGNKQDPLRLSIGLAPGEDYGEPFDVARAESEEPR